MSLVSEDCFLPYSIWDQWLWQYNSRYGKKHQEEIFSWTKRLVRQVWSRDFCACKAWSSNSTLSGLSVESSVDLGMSLPSTVRRNGHDMPPNHGQIYAYEGALLTCRHLALASCLYKDYIMTTASCWVSTPPERSSGWRSEIRHSALGKTQKNWPSDSQMFSGKDFMSPNSCIFLHLERH